MALENSFEKLNSNHDTVTQKKNPQTSLGAVSHRNYFVSTEAHPPTKGNTQLDNITAQLSYSINVYTLSQAWPSYCR